MVDQPLRDDLRDALLGPLHMHFLAAKAAYADYLANGKSFLFACSLRRLNLSARQLLLDKGHLLPEALKADAVALIGHYDVWLTLWDALAELARPRPEDEFVFENRHTYPRAAEAAPTAATAAMQTRTQIAA